MNVPSLTLALLGVILIYFLSSKLFWLAVLETWRYVETFKSCAVTLLFISLFVQRCVQYRISVFVVLAGVRSMMFPDFHCSIKYILIVIIWKARSTHGHQNSHTVAVITALNGWIVDISDRWSASVLSADELIWVVLRNRVELGWADRSWFELCRVTWFGLSWSKMSRVDESSAELHRVHLSSADLS